MRLYTPKYIVFDAPQEWRELRRRLEREARETAARQGAARDGTWPKAWAGLRLASVQDVEQRLAATLQEGAHVRRPEDRRAGLLITNVSDPHRRQQTGDAIPTITRGPARQPVVEYGNIRTTNHTAPFHSTPHDAKTHDPTATDRRPSNGSDCDSAAREHGTSDDVPIRE